LTLFAVRSQLKQAKRDIAALEEQLKVCFLLDGFVFFHKCLAQGKGKDSEDDDELDFYKKITEKKDQVWKNCTFWIYFVLTFQKIANCCFEAKDGKQRRSRAGEKRSGRNDSCQGSHFVNLRMCFCSFFCCV
jgi:hypothetical protein